MKNNFKTIIVVFLVALLGAGLGTFGVMSLYGGKLNIPSSNNLNSTVSISEVNYPNKAETSYTDAIEIAYDTVVEIQTKVKTTSSGYSYFFGGGESESYSTSSGSGVIISEDGYIVTNEHVIERYASDDAVNVTLYNGVKYTAKIIGYDSRTDLAVLKIDAGTLKYSSFADSSALVMGQDVIAIGNPLGLGISCSNGIVSALEKEIYINKVYMTVIQTNAAVNDGNSGGGLFDLNGNLVGIVNAKKSTNALSSTSIEGMGYAIPSNTVKKIVQELIQNGYVKDRAALGITVYTGNAYYSSDGVLVTGVLEGSGADEAGIEVNDIITEVNGVTVKSYADLSKVLEAKAVGDEVIVKILREDKTLEVKVVLQQSTN